MSLGKKNQILLKTISFMANQKCISCGIGFFSPTGSEKCSKCAGQESAGHEGHDSCGCGHSH